LCLILGSDGDDDGGVGVGVRWAACPSGGMTSVVCPPPELLLLLLPPTDDDDDDDADEESLECGWDGVVGVVVCCSGRKEGTEGKEGS
jgi:hypothetical protein